MLYHAPPTPTPFLMSLMTFILASEAESEPYDWQLDFTKRKEFYFICSNFHETFLENGPILIQQCKQFRKILRRNPSSWFPTDFRNIYGADP